MGDLEFVKYENNVTMSRDRRSLSHTPFEIHQVNSTRKVRHNDSPTSSILKTPTAIFVTTRNSSAKTKKLKFANGPVDLQTLRNGSHESSVSVDSSEELGEDRKLNNNGEVVSEDNIIEVAISPVKTMQVSPESWKAFLAYKKYGDYSNETEKTDYTYSRLSKYRNKEIIPEFPVRPNLSRSSIYSRRYSSISLPGSQSSLNDSYLSGYDFKVHSESNSEIINDYNKTPSQAIKFSRSKYYLRSSSFDGTETGETEFKTEFKSPYLEDYLNNSAPEYFSKTTTTYTTSANPKYNYNYQSSNIRSMDLDDEDIDEVDVDNSVRFGKQYQGSTWSQNKPRTLSDNVKNFFTAIFLYVTSVGTITKNGFSKYILRRKEDPSYYSSGDSLRYDKMGYATSRGSWTPWTNEKSYSSPEYYSSYSGGYYGRRRSWYETISDYFYDRFYQIRNLLWGSGAGYGAYRYQDTSRRRKLWWLLIPLLLLAGAFLGYIDFFSNPKAILNTMYNWLIFIPSFLHYTIMVFIPELIFKMIPHFILNVVPNFLTVTLPYFFMTVVPYYFWAVVHFFANISISGVWNMVVGALSTLYNVTANFFTAAGESALNFSINTISTGYTLSYEYLLLFFSNFCTHSYKVMTYMLNYVLYSIDIVYYAFSLIMAYF